MPDYKKLLNRSWSRIRKYLRYRPLSKPSPRKQARSLPSVGRLLKNNFKLLAQLKWQTLGIVAIQIVIIYLFDSTSSEQFSVVTLVGIIAAMSFIWLARQTIQDEPQLTMKTALYRGPSQIVPFLLLLLLIGLQSLPFSIGGVIYQIGVNSSPPIAIFYWEKLLFAAGWLLLSIPTLYWLLPSLLGLIVVCIPGVSPLEARRATQELVSGRIFKVWLKLFWLILVYAVVFGAIVVGVITSLPQLTIYVITYGGALVLPVFTYQLFAVYQALRGDSGD